LLEEKAENSHQKSQHDFLVNHKYIF